MSGDPNMTAQEATMRGLAKSLRDWAKDLSAVASSGNIVNRTVGRLEGLAEGLEAIAELARLDPEDKPHAS